MSEPGQMHLAVYNQGTGHHLGGWRLPGAEAGGENFPLLQRLAQMAEQAKFDMIFFADSPYTSLDFEPGSIVRLEPLTVLAALAVSTSRIGLVATASTTYTEPYNLARQFASIDHISGGRTGWNIVTSAQAGAAANFGADPHPPHETRYAMASEFVDIFLGLMDS